MNNLELRFVLGLFNVPDQMRDDIEKAFPGIDALISDTKMLEPLINEAIPILKRAYPNFVALTPVAGEVLQFIEDKKQPSVS